MITLKLFLLKPGREKQKSLKSFNVFPLTFQKLQKSAVARKKGFKSGGQKTEYLMSGVN